MNDMFDGKRKMIQDLLGMLKSHAASEVSNGLQKPEGEGDMHGIQMEKVEVLPDHEMDTPTPEHDVITHEMAHGGVVEKVNGQPEGEIPYESADGHPDKEGSAHEEATESESEREAEGDIAPASMFSHFLGKKKRK